MNRTTDVRESKRQATAYHEVGHAVAALHEKMRIRSATVIPSRGFSGQVSHESPLSGIRLDIGETDRAKIRAQRLIVIALAGPAAQKRFNPGSLRSYHGESDHEIAVDLATRLNSSEKSTDAYLKWLSIVADDRVSASWRQIEAVAKALLVRGTLSKSEIFAAIRADRPHGRRPPRPANEE